MFKVYKRICLQSEYNMCDLHISCLICEAINDDQGVVNIEVHVDLLYSRVAIEANHRNCYMCPSYSIFEHQRFPFNEYRFEILKLWLAPPLIKTGLPCSVMSARSCQNLAILTKLCLWSPLPIWTPVGCDTSMKGDVEGRRR